MNQSATFTKTYSRDDLNGRARLPTRIPAIKTPLYCALMGRVTKPQGGTGQNKDNSDLYQSGYFFAFAVPINTNPARHNIETRIMTNDNTQNNRIIRTPEMIERSGLSRATLLRWEKQGKFPKRRKLNTWLVGWLESDFQAWLNNGDVK